MKKISILWFGLLLLWACSDGNGSGGVIDISNPDDSESIEQSSSDIQSSSSSKPNEDKSCSSSTIKSASSSSVNKKNSSSSEPTSSSSKDSKSSSSNSESGSSSSNNSESGSSSSRNTESSSSSSKSSSSTQSSSSLELKATEVSPIRIQSISITPNADKTTFIISGSATLDTHDTTAISGSDSDPFFTKVDFLLAHVNEHGQNENASLQLQYTPLTGPTAAISFEEQGTKIIDSAKTQCGTFKLFIILKASNDIAIEDKFITIDSVEFVRDPAYCQAEPGSTIAQVELRKFTGQMQTSTTRGYSFKNDAEVPVEQAQIQVSKDELTGQLTLHGVNSYKVAKYSNGQNHEYDDDWTATNLPPAPAHTTDFKYSPTKLADATDFEKEAFWVVIGPRFNQETADDFYAVALKESEFIEGTNVAQLEIVYYKK